MENQFCPSHWLDDVRRLAARTNPIDLVLLVLVAAFGLSMCLTLAADAEIGRSRASLGFSQAGQVPAGAGIPLPVSYTQRAPGN